MGRDTSGSFRGGQAKPADQLRLLPTGFQGLFLSKSLLKSSAIVSVMTLVSRILGFVRDMVIAISFGATGLTDAFFVAFRIPNLLRRMFAEGAFAQAFVPVFTEYRSNRSTEELEDLADHVAGSLLLILSVITALGVLAAPLLILLFAPGFGDSPDQQALATDMLKITFPYALFISLTALSGGILNSFGKFAVPAFTPVFLNLCMIAAAIWLAPLMDEPVKALAWGVFAAGVVQLLFQLPALYRIGLVPRPKLRIAHPGVRRIIKLMLPALFASSVGQLNMLLNTIIASFLAAGSISWLYYSDRFVELPLAIFGIALSTVILPKLSQEHAVQSTDAFSRTLDWGVRLSIVIALPAMLGLMLLSGPIIATLLQYQSFTHFETRMVAIALAVYALGLPGFVLVKVLAPGFFARQDTVTPVKIGLIAIGSNIVLYAVVALPWMLLGGPAPHAALAFCAAAASFVNAGLLFRQLRKQAVYQPVSGWYPLLARVAGALLIMGLMLLWLSPELAAWENWNALQRAVRLAGLILVAVISYTATLLMLGLRPRELLRSG